MIRKPWYLYVTPKEKNVFYSIIKKNPSFSNHAFENEGFICTILSIQHQRAPSQLVECTRVVAITAVARTTLWSHLVSHLLYINEA